MRVLLVSPYHGGSHKAWAEGYSRFSQHEILSLTLPARFWKWRMHGAAVTLARRFAASNLQPDLIMATDMLDLTTFLSLLRGTTSQLPTVLYMHENQLTYPLPADGTTGPMRRQLGERDQHYAFINYASMLAADAIWFNSAYHRESFFAALPRFLNHFPEYQELGTIKNLGAKSQILPVGIDFERLTGGRSAVLRPGARSKDALILWNQRWEYDKNPEAFFAALGQLSAEGIPFRVALCGQQFGRQPPVFADGIDRLGTRIYHSGFAPPEQYARLLWEADVTVSTAWHEFFGISVLEAMHAQTFPILPARLSYPEIVPSQFQEACLYADKNGLLERLRHAVTHPAETRELAAAIAPSTRAFDWRKVAPLYDEGLAALCV